jgi:hypothetical protein
MCMAVGDTLLVQLVRQSAAQLSELWFIGSLSVMVHIMSFQSSQAADAVEGVCLLGCCAM